MLEKGFIKDNIFTIAAISVTALVLRLLCFDFASPDYNNFLLPWINEFRQGGFLALKTTSSNYNLPYLYLLALMSYIPAPDLYMIKLLSIVFDFVIAFTLMGLVHADENGQMPLFIFAVTLFFPTFWLNSAMWAQCDSIYAAFCLLAYASVIREKPVRAAVYAGLAFSFKLQAVFLLPIFGVMLIFRKMKFLHALLFPFIFAIPYIITSIPAMLLGWDISRVVGIYTGQVEIYSDYLTLNAPSMFALLEDAPKHPNFEYGIAATGFFIVFTLTLALIKRKSADGRLFSAFALAICLGVVWLLPSMHDRYFYLAEVFALLYAALNPRRWYVALMVLFGSLAGYHAYLVLGTLSDKLWLAALIMLGALLVVIQGIFAHKGAQKRFDTPSGLRYNK